MCADTPLLCFVDTCLSLLSLLHLLCSAGLGDGAEVAVSPVMGKGFSVDAIPADAHPTVLLFATGV
jgi:hypothetical protein